MKKLLMVFALLFFATETNCRNFYFTAIYTKNPEGIPFSVKTNWPFLNVLHNLCIDISFNSSDSSELKTDLIRTLQCSHPVINSVLFLIL
jgi:hypothetical protein